MSRARAAPGPFPSPGERVAVTRELGELRAARCLGPVAGTGTLVDRLLVVAQRRAWRPAARVLRERRRRPPRYRWLPPDEVPEPAVVDLLWVDPPGGDDGPAEWWGRSAG